MSVVAYDLRAPAARATARTLALAGISLLIVGAIAAPSERSWAEVDSGRGQSPSRRPGPSEKNSHALGTLRVGASVAGGDVVAVDRPGADLWRLVVRHPTSGDVVVRITRDIAHAEERAPPYGLSSEPSAAPAEHRRSVVFALADMLRRERPTP